MKTKLKAYLKVHIPIFLGLPLAVILVTKVFGDFCPLQILFDLPCPFCGMTRAWLNFLRGDVSLAFRQHPFFLFAPPFLFVIFHEGTVFRNHKRLFITLVVIGTAALIAIFLFRLFFDKTGLLLPV